MFASIALAQRIEGAEARLSESLGRAAMRTEPEGVAFVDAIGGGVAVYTGPASPMNKMIGAGFDGVPSETHLATIEEKFRQRSAPLQAEVATLTNPAFVARLTKRGYALQNFENVMGRAIRDEDAARPDGISIDVMGSESAEAWLGRGIPSLWRVDRRRTGWCRVAAPGRRNRAALWRRDDPGVPPPRCAGGAPPPPARRRRRGRLHGQDGETPHSRPRITGAGEKGSPSVPLLPSSC